MIKNKNTVIISLIVSVVVLSAIAIVAYPRFFKSSELGSDSVPSDSNFVEDTDQPLTDGTAPNEDKVITSAPSTESSDVEKFTLTRAEQSGDYIRVSAILTNASSGTCILTASKDGSPDITKTAEIIVGPSYYTCNGFRISRSEFTTGSWSVTVTHELNGKTAVSDTKVINVN